MQKDWLQLLLQPHLACGAKRKLVNHFGSPAAVLAAGAARIADALGATTIRNPRLRSDLAASWNDILDQTGGRFIGFTDPSFPALLNEIPSPPLGLFVQGDASLLGSDQIALVGSRRASPAGLETARRLAATLAERGLTVTSGLASGIDGSAHRGCLEARGRTVAVIANGLDVVYPKSHAALQQQIARDGLVVTEHPPGTAPRRRHFPQRNRLISGLSLGTVVVEAGLRSGSLITARLAGEQGREVFAVPGPVQLETSRGCHHLLRQGACLVESVDDILAELGHFGLPVTSNNAPPREPTLTEPERTLYGLIDYAPTGVDQLIERSGLTADQVSSILVLLEIQGLIVQTAGGYQRLS